MAVATGLASAKTLRVCMTDVPHAPWRLAEAEGRVLQRGLDFDLIREAERLSSWRMDVQVLSGRRCLVELAAGRADATIGLSHNAERARQYRYPMRQGEPDLSLALRIDATTIYRRRGAAVQWDGEHLSLPAGQAVQVQAGHSVIAQLKAQGVPVAEQERSAFMTLSKLVVGEADAAVVFTSEGQALVAAHPQFASLEALSPVLARKPYFVVFGEPFARAHEAELAGLWRAFALASQAPAYQAAVRQARKVR
jgi:polar amino acid transport system substrate-binding protein